MAQQKAAQTREVKEVLGQEVKEFEQRVLDLARVTRVTKGGKRMRFRALVVIGDKRGRVGFAVEKGSDVAAAVEKAVRKAKKGLIKINMKNDTIVHEVKAKFGAAKLLLKPAPRGTGVKVGGAPRVVLELAGVENIVGKVLGSKNKINNVKATFVALEKFR